MQRNSLDDVLLDDPVQEILEAKTSKEFYDLLTPYVGAFEDLIAYFHGADYHGLYPEIGEWIEQGGVQGLGYALLNFVDEVPKILDCALNHLNYSGMRQLMGRLGNIVIQYYPLAFSSGDKRPLILTIEKLKKIGIDYLEK